MMGYGDFGWMGGGGSVWMLLGWALVLALVVWGASTSLRSRGGEPREPLPLEILKRRYAAGELTASEFEQAKHVLV